MKKFLFFAAALLCLVACNQKEELTAPIGPGKTCTLTATINLNDNHNAVARMITPGTISGDELSFTWEIGDKVTISNEAGTEQEIFTVQSVKDGVASLTGKALSDMSSYKVTYGDSTASTIIYQEGTFTPIASGEGTEFEFTIDSYCPVLKLDLTGAVTVTSIKYYVNDVLKTTLDCGTGITLTSTAKAVYFPVLCKADDKEARLDFCNADDVIMGQVLPCVIAKNDYITCPVLNVAKPSPKAAFKEGTTLILEFNESGSPKRKLTFTNTDGTYTCTEAIEDSNPGTPSNYTVINGSGRKLRFVLEGTSTLDYNADVTPATAIVTGPYKDYTLDGFAINNANIIDSLSVSAPPAYICFETTSGSGTVAINSGRYLYPNLQYTTTPADPDSWVPFEASTAMPDISTDTKLYVRAGDTPNARLAESYYGMFWSPYTSLFVTTGSIKVSGNIMALLNQEPATELTSDNTYAFYTIFMGTSIVDASELILPTNVVESCYGWLFCGCTALKKAPILPATTMATTCYKYMFQGCSALESVPALPAKEIAPGCYSDMFSGCSALESVPTDLLPAKTLYNQCYYNMFIYCSKLKNAPDLPATTLAGSCYMAMFDYCTNLEAAPVLAAEALKPSCYGCMFAACPKINSVTMLGSVENEDSSLLDWLAGAAATGTVYVKDAATKATLETLQYTTAAGTSPAIPDGWTVVVK